MQSLLSLVNTDPKYLNSSDASNFLHSVGIYVVARRLVLVGVTILFLFPDLPAVPLNWLLISSPCMLPPLLFMINLYPANVEYMVSC
jgi:hypothetical protein